MTDVATIFSTRSKIQLHIAVSSEVINLQTVSTNDDTLVISWEPPATPNGNILSYSVSIINLKDGTTVRQENTISTTITQTNLGKKTSVCLSNC